MCASVSKPVSPEDLSDFESFIKERLSQLITKSIKYIEASKEDYKLTHTDDLSNPQLFKDEYCYSIYWNSDKGEALGQSVIGVDFDLDSLEPYTLTIGD